METDKNEDDEKKKKGNVYTPEGLHTRVSPTITFQHVCTSGAKNYF